MRVILAGVAGLIVVVLVAGGAVLALNGRDEASVADALPFAGGSVPSGIQMPSFSLEDERGGIVRSSDLRGKVAVLTFLDAQCVDACPVIGSVVARSLDELKPAERAQVVAVGISVDPAGDTVAARRTFLAQHRATGRIRYASASLRELTPVWRDFQVLATAVSGDDNLHSSPVRVYSVDGEWLTTLNAGSTLTTANLVHDLRLALGGAG